MKFAVYVITLDPQSPKATALANDLHTQGVAFTFFSAVDGRQGIPPLQPGEILDHKKTLRYRQSILGGAEVGIYLSQWRVINTAYNQGLDFVCVMEDDVRLEPSFSRVLEQLLTREPATDFVRFMGLRIHKRKIVDDLGDGHVLTRPIKGLCGAQGYVMSRAGMAKVIGYAGRIWQPVDKLFDHFWDYDLHCFAVEPHIVWEKNTQSSIPKPNFNKKLPFQKWITRHADKLLRSVQHKWYVWSHWSAFYPNQKPSRKVGRTERMH